VVPQGKILRSTYSTHTQHIENPSGVVKR
jgi:hypothetical protein